jgi:cellulose synthase/poly-beta-1,6-N-acetylglucosamine synthase-like glycosyltransferase
MGYFEDEKVAAVTCLVLPDKRDSFVRRIQFLEYAVSFGLNNTLLSSIDSSYVVPGPFTIFRRSVFEKVGYYEPGNLAEDMEFGLRLKNHSLKIVNCYEAVVYTDVPKDLVGLFVQRNRWCRGGVFNFIRYRKLMFNKKNPDFGFFVMPFIFASQVLIVAVLVRMFLFFAHDLLVFLLISFNCLSLGGSPAVDLSGLSLPSSILFFIVSYFIVGIYFWVCFKSIKYSLNWKDFFPLLILIFIYPYFITFTYSQGYFKEMIGVRGSWRRVST